MSVIYYHMLRERAIRSAKLTVFTINDIYDSDSCITREIMSYSWPELSVYNVAAEQ